MSRYIKCTNDICVVWYAHVLIHTWYNHIIGWTMPVPVDTKLPQPKLPKLPWVVSQQIDLITTTRLANRRFHLAMLATML